MTNFMKLIWDFLRWLISLSGLKMCIVICLLVIGGQFYLMRKRDENNESKVFRLTNQLYSCENLSRRDERWWAMRTDSLVSVKTQKYEELLLKIIEKADLADKEQKETNRITQKTIENLSKK